MPERLSSRQVSSIPARLVLGTREEDADVASYLCSDRFRVKDKESNEVSNWVLTSCRPHRVTKRRMKKKKKKREREEEVVVVAVAVVIVTVVIVVVAVDLLVVGLLSYRRAT